MLFMRGGFMSMYGMKLPALCAFLCLIACSVVFSAAPMAGTQAPGYFRMMLGDFEITALLDGTSEFSPELLLNTTPALTKKLWEQQFIFSGKAPGCVNAFLINTGKHLILIDAGAGGVFGPTMGFAVENLRASGYRPEDVDTILLTHLHGDHVGGLIGKDGERVFPNAVVMVSKAENETWLSAEEAAKAPPARQNSFSLVRKAAAPYLAAKCWKTFEPGAELFPGLQTVAATGHTPGHTAYLVTSNNQQLLFMGDVIHNAATQFSHPSIAVQYDSDSVKAVECRKAVFSRLARDKILAAGAHLAFPGIGYLRAEGAGYVWIPVTRPLPGSTAQ